MVGDKYTQLAPLASREVVYSQAENKTNISTPTPPLPVLPVPHSHVACTPFPPCLYCLYPTPTAFIIFALWTNRFFNHSDFAKKYIYDAILTVFKQYHHKIY